MSEVGEAPQPTTEQNQSLENRRQSLREKTKDFFVRHSLGVISTVTGTVMGANLSQQSPLGFVIGAGIGLGVGAWIETGHRKIDESLDYSNRANNSDKS